MILRRPIVSVDIEVCRGVVENRSGLLVENSIEGLVHGMNEYLAGNIEVKEVNFDEYRKESLRMFYQKSCGFGRVLDGQNTE
jgi:CDP-glycerol glycerophosphotransferase